jgi:poly-D-alanine transfer protein DltD
MLVSPMLVAPHFFSYQLFTPTHLTKLPTTEESSAPAATPLPKMTPEKYPLSKIGQKKFFSKNFTPIPP